MIAQHIEIAVVEHELLQRFQGAWANGFFQPVQRQFHPPAAAFQLAGQLPGGQRWGEVGFRFHADTHLAMSQLRRKLKLNIATKDFHWFRMAVLALISRLDGANALLFHVEH